MTQSTLLLIPSEVKLLLIVSFVCCPQIVQIMLFKGRSIDLKWNFIEFPFSRHKIYINTDTDVLMAFHKLYNHLTEIVPKSLFAFHVVVFYILLCGTKQHFVDFYKSK